MPAKGQKSTVDQRGSKNPNWKGGRPFKGNSGYLFIRVNGRLIRYHRVVMERHLGRKLKITEIVHHKNENKEDNRLANLQIMTDKQHTAHHNKTLLKTKYWNKFRRNSKGRFIRKLKKIL